jgi:PAS domain S-box-containing protein
VCVLAVTISARLPVAIGATEWIVFGAAAGCALALLLLWLRERRVARVQAARRRTEVDRELGAVAQLSERLAGVRDARDAARQLVGAVFEPVTADFAAVALVDEEARRARGLVARGRPEVEEWWPSVRVHLDSEPSGIATAARERTTITIDDVTSSALVNQRLAEQVRARSAVFVPVAAEGAIQAVLVVAREEQRSFTPDEVALLQAAAAETALAFERVRSAAALEDALAREQLVARIGRRVRSELDLGAVLQTSVEELGRAVGVTRCFIRLGRSGDELPAVAEWEAPGASKVGDRTPRMPALNLAVRDRRTVLVTDIETATELHDPALGDVDILRHLGVRAVLATPVVVFDEVIGVFGLHRDQVGPWGDEEVALAEAVAREAGLAIHTARLLDEDRRRVQQQEGLLEAAAAVSGELRLEGVLGRLVGELVKLLGADAADLFIEEPGARTLRCVAEYGLGPEVLGWELDRGSGLSGKALDLGRTVRSADYERVDRPVQHPAYRGFNAGMAAPLTWGGATRGVIGVGSRSETQEFSEVDAQVLETFAGLASLALSNAETFERSERQARIERGFYRIASLLGEPVSSSAAYEALAHAACEAFAAAFGAVLTPVDDRLELAGTHEPEPGEATALAAQLGGVRVLTDAVRGGRVLAASEVADDERLPAAFRERARAAGYHSLLVTPFELPRRSERGGVLVVFREVRHLSDDDLALAHHLGGAARGALERSELFERERTSRALAQQLARTGGLLATELDPAAVLEELVGQAPSLLGADAAAIHVLVGDELVTAAVAGAATEAARGARSPVAGTPAGDVIQARAPLALADAERAGVVADDDPVLASGRRAFLGVPLYATEGDLRGTLAVYEREPREWRDEEVEALVALAGNAAAVLANAELYQRVAIEKERLDAILGNVADGIVAVDPSGQIVLWNRAAERVTGVPESEALGRPLVRVLGRDLAAGETAGDRLVPLPRGGEQIWLSVSEAVMHDRTGASGGRIYAFRDVSAERIVEQMKTTFVSTVSQELRRPLTSIYGFSETLLRQDVVFSDEERHTFLGYIAAEAARLTTIVDQLLSVARLDAGDLEVDLAPTDVRSVMTEAVETFKGASVLNGHRFVLDVPDEPLDASVDREKLRQILDALMDNAVKYSPGGGTVTLAARRRPDAVELRVTDEGIGIAPDEHERIFRKFYRSADAVGGSGLGLFIVQGLVRAMGGRIWVDSDAGRGASFVFQVPPARGRARRGGGVTVGRQGRRV